MDVVSTADFKTGLTIVVDSAIYEIIDFQHVKPGKGAAFVRTKLRNVKAGGVIERSFNPSTDKFTKAEITRVEMQYLYNDGDMYYFMNLEDGDQLSLPNEQIGESLKFVKESDMVKIVSADDGVKAEIISVEPPMFVELLITETEPGFKGNTATNATKPAIVETGARVMVPLFVENGEMIKIDTRSGEYLSRV